MNLFGRYYCRAVVIQSIQTLLRVNTFYNTIPFHFWFPDRKSLYFSRDKSTSKSPSEFPRIDRWHGTSGRIIGICLPVVHSYYKFHRNKTWSIIVPHFCRLCRANANSEWTNSLCLWGCVFINWLLGQVLLQGTFGITHCWWWFNLCLMDGRNDERINVFEIII